MANEYLIRKPTSTGNRRVGTISVWTKNNRASGAGDPIFSSGYYTGLTDRDQIDMVLNGDLYWQFEQYGYPTAGGSSTNYYSRNSSYRSRDNSSWYHILVAFDTTQITAQDRAKIFINGIRLDTGTSSNAFAQNYQFPIGALTNGLGIKIGNGVGAMQYGSTYYNGELCDYFYVDGQALTPDVFGFYKQGKGYISVGSTQSTDFRPGQWVPKTPRVIKTEINRRGGFGVNGFYLPMNDSRNFGADFHGEPNSIITLNEKLPQPRVGVATTASVGLGYTDALRTDPYAANLVLALPFVSGGLSSGFGDYAPSIKGSGSPKVATLNGGISIASTASYYGSAVGFTSTSSQYLSFPTNNDFSFGTGDFTLEHWIYLKSYNNLITFDQWLNGATGQGNYQLYFYSGDNGKIRFYYDGSSNFLTGSAVPLNQWSHVAVSKKGTTISVYIDGVCSGIQTNVTNSIGRSDTTLWIGAQHNIGPILYFDGYIQDLRIYKGVAKYTGGFDVPRPYTPVGIATWRAVPDTTANNFATLNPLANSNAPLTNGNLTMSPSGNNATAWSTFAVKSGKWYWEIYKSSGDMALMLSQQARFNGYQTGSDTTSLSLYMYYTSGGASANRFTYNGSNTAFPSGFGDDDNGTLYNFFLDFDTNTFRVRRNNDVTTEASFSMLAALVSDPLFIGYSVTTTWPAGSFTYNFGQNPTFSGNTTTGTFTDSNGKGLFKYQPPSGFLALCEDNLPTPAIADPGKYFKTVLYTGDGNNGRSIVGVGFTPDLVWVKARTGAFSHRISDSVRGAGYSIFSDSTSAESALDANGYISGFGADGFVVSPGATNANGTNLSGTTYTAWCWRAGAGTTSTNTNGSITSVVSVNQDAGFSIVSYTGTGANATVGHGLGRSPAFVVVKTRSLAGENWNTWHKSLSNTSYRILLNTTGAVDTTSPTVWSSGGINPTTTTFTVGSSTGANGSGSTYIAYCWAEIEGFSKAFSYVGNGSADGPFTFLNFKPALIIIKRTDNVGNWQIYDSSRMSTNPNNGVLFPNLSNIEGVGSAYDIDFLSNGFKLRSTDTDRNASGSTYVGFAWAESPFTTSNSK